MPSTGSVVRRARTRLGKGRRSPSFLEAALVAQHIHQLRAAAVFLPIPVILAGFGLSLFTGPLPAMTWTCVTLAATLLLVLFAKRRDVGADGSPLEAELPSHGRFLFGHLMVGLCWSYLLFLDCPDCGLLRFEIFQFAVLILAIAMTAMISSTLRFVVLVAFGPLAAVLLLRSVADASPVDATMHAVLAGAVPFFAGVAEILRRSAIVSIRHQAEKDELIGELERASLLSNEARQNAEDASKAKSQFLATMSHELRTPLNAILGFSEVISNEILGPIGNPSYKEYVQDIHSSGQHLLGLINEILDLSRVEAGRYTLNEEAVDLTRVANECLSTVRLRAETKGIRLAGEFEPGLPALWGDERALRQIILNLLSNAVKFTPKGGTIALKVGWTAGGGQYASIRDNGPGIPQNEIPTVLSSFGQGSNAIKNAEQGTGLGLPIVQALVKLHDGQFELISRQGQGTETIAIFPHTRVLEVMPALDMV